MYDYKEVTFVDISDERGHLTVIESGKTIPFEIKRIYYITGVDEGVKRGAHAHRDLQQILLCIHGEVKIKVITPTEEKIFILNNQAKGLFLGEYTWREMYDFSKDAVLLVLASQHYKESDYIRDYNKYIEEVKNKRLGDELYGNSVC